jgi:hypothetical protein
LQSEHHKGLGDQHENRECLLPVERTTASLWRAQPIEIVPAGWADRNRHGGAEHAREVAGQLTDPSSRKAVLELAEVSIGSPRAAATPAVQRRRELARKD